MFVHRPKLHPMAAAALKDMRAKGLAPRDDHVLWLQDAAQRIRKTVRRRAAELVDWPVPCGGALLYPMSLAAFEWWRNRPFELQKDVFVQGFVCAHSHHPDVLKPLTGYWSTRKAARNWAVHLTCSKKALSAAVESVWPENNACEVDNPPGQIESSHKEDLPDYGAFVLALCKQFPGTTPQYWAWEVPMEIAFDSLRLVDAGEESSITASELEANVAFRAVKRAIEKELAPNV